MFSVYAQVKYKKSVWGVVKGIIEKNTWTGLKDFYAALLTALQSEYWIPPAEAKEQCPQRGSFRFLESICFVVSLSIFVNNFRSSFAAPTT